MARIIKPPAPIDLDRHMPSVFLSGSIDMGQAEPWQSAVEQALADRDIVILNPRRDAWDASWEQAIDNAVFRSQVEWELSGLEQATLVAIYFAPATRAPITLLELGLCARANKVIACCPNGFWRKGNVDVVCDRYGIPMVPDLAALIAFIRNHFQ